MDIELARTADLDAACRREVIDVFAQSFAVPDADAALQQYFSNLDRMFLARSAGQLVGFQFYRQLSVRGRTVHHFSLAGRLPADRYRGLQAQFGAELIRRAVLRTPPWRPLFLAGVANSPKSYANMHAIGGRCYPDVLRPHAPNPFGDWYGAVADALHIEGVGPDGVMPDRMSGLGFGLVQEASSGGPLAAAYTAYVGGNVDNGIFTLISLVPVRDLPGYLLSKTVRRRRPAQRRTLQALQPERTP